MGSPSVRPVDGMARLWAGGERHVANVESAPGGRCAYCHCAPARVYLARHLLCGVCWHRTLLLRRVKEGTND